MTRYHAVLGQIISSIVPPQQIAVPSPPISGLHVGDAVVFGSLTPLIANTIKDTTLPDVIEKFSHFKMTDRTVTRQLRTNTEDPTAVRNVSVWLGPGVAIGGQSVRSYVPISLLFMEIFRSSMNRRHDNHHTYPAQFNGFFLLRHLVNMPPAFHHQRSDTSLLHRQ
jgi:hypothetical protein